MIKKILTLTALMGTISLQIDASALKQTKKTVERMVVEDNVSQRLKPPHPYIKQSYLKHSTLKQKEIIKKEFQDKFVKYLPINERILIEDLEFKILHPEYRPYKENNVDIKVKKRVLSRAYSLAFIEEFNELLNFNHPKGNFYFFSFTKKCDRYIDKNWPHESENFQLLKGKSCYAKNMVTYSNIMVFGDHKFNPIDKLLEVASYQFVENAIDENQKYKAKKRKLSKNVTEVLNVKTHFGTSDKGVTIRGPFLNVQPKFINVQREDKNSGMYLHWDGLSGLYLIEKKYTSYNIETFRTFEGEEGLIYSFVYRMPYDKDLNLHLSASHEHGNTNRDDIIVSLDFGIKYNSFKEFKEIIKIK
ncbi:hypothetical protein ACFL1H_00275 [Nanoarchaeota archaeon]